MMDTPNIQWPSGNSYLVGDRGTEALGVKDISSAISEIIVSTLNFETDPIPGVGSGNLPWLTTTSNPHTGARCFRSGAILANQQSLWTFTIPAPATALRMWWRVSSEAGFDFLEIYKDSVSVPNRILQQSGTGNVWTQATLNIAGATSLIIRYVKDGSSSAGLDTVFVDDFEWIIPGFAAVQNYEPFHLDINNKLKVTVLGETVAVTGTVSIPHLNCATDSVEICNDAGSPISVQGTVALDAATLVALETINIGNVPHVIVDSLPEVEIKNDAGNPVPVSANNLDIRDLTFLADKVDVSGSSVAVTGTVTTTPARISTYSAAFFASALAASCTDKIVIVGSATKLVKIRKIGITGIQTVASQILIRLLKRSSDDTGGAFTTPLLVSHDSNNSAATAVIRNYSANPAVLGALVGDLRAERHFIPTAALNGQAEALIWDTAQTDDQPIILRGITQILAINFNATTIAGGSFDGWIEWTEE